MLNDLKNIKKENENVTVNTLKSSPAVLHCHTEKTWEEGNLTHSLLFIMTDYQPQTQLSEQADRLMIDCVNGEWIHILWYKVKANFICINTIFSQLVYFHCYWSSSFCWLVFAICGIMEHFLWVLSWFDHLHTAIPILIYQLVKPFDHIF